jgi:hypothetical protein
VRGADLAELLHLRERRVRGRVHRPEVRAHDQVLDDLLEVVAALLEVLGDLPEGVVLAQVGLELRLELRIVGVLRGEHRLLPTNARNAW